MLSDSVCLACSGGGHLTELLLLKDFFSNKKHFFVTFKRQNTLDLKNEKIYFVSDPKRNFFLFAVNFFESLKIFLKEKPKIILSTGAGVAIPICFIGKLFGSKIIFVESYCRINEPSFSGKIIYRIADLFVVQWPEMLKHYPKAKYFGGFF